jgi:predicted ester cyclase
MNSGTAQALADGYVAYLTTGDTSVLGMFSPDFYDNVSKTRGLDIFRLVGAWLDESFAERSAELHLVTHTSDTVVMWCTAYGRHVGNGFPRLKGLPVEGNHVAWPQVHIFRLADGLVVEHWAVRDDAAMIDAVSRRREAHDTVGEESGAQRSS